MDPKKNEMRSFYDICNSAGTDKVQYHGYHYFYPRFLESFREESFRMLEIGYGDGESAKAWLEYFPNAEIMVMDIDVTRIDGRLKVMKADQSNISDLQTVAGFIKKAKFIIDDGSHHPVHQLETFEYFFRNLLEPGGVYIIEDIECSYWNPKETIYGYQVGYFSLMDHLKNYVDIINHEYTGKNNDLGISSVTFGQNCVVITKRTEKEEEYFNRTYRFEWKL
jgi:spermidine synthase